MLSGPGLDLFVCCLYTIITWGVCSAAIQQHPTRLCDPFLHNAGGYRPGPVLQQPQPHHWHHPAAALCLHHVHGAPKLPHCHHERRLLQGEFWSGSENAKSLFAKLIARKACKSLLCMQVLNQADWQLFRYQNSCASTGCFAFVVYMCAVAHRLVHCLLAYHDVASCETWAQAYKHLMSLLSFSVFLVLHLPASARYRLSLVNAT